MAYLVVDKKGRELLFDECPKWNRVYEIWETITKRIELQWVDYHDFSRGAESEEVEDSFEGIELPKGTIKKIINKDLSFADEPICLDFKENDNR